MRIYFVNLDGDANRRAFMERQLEGLDAVRISAQLSTDWPETSDKLKPAERACLESHRVAWREFLASAAPFGCFLEDDVHLSPDFFACVAGSDWIPPGAHSVKLDTLHQKVMLSHRRATIGGRTLGRLETLHESAAGYILSREGAEVYLAATENPSLPVDRILFPVEPCAKGLAIWQMTPAVLIQDFLLDDSDPGKKRFSTGVQQHRLNKSRRRERSRAEHLRKIRKEIARLGVQAVQFGRAARRRLIRGLRWELVPFRATMSEGKGSE